MIFKHKLLRIIKNNSKDIPYEGIEIDSEAIVDETMELLVSAMKGFGTHVLQNYTITPKGWESKLNGIVKPRSEVINEFLNKIK